MPLKQQNTSIKKISMNESERKHLSIDVTFTYMFFFIICANKTLYTEFSIPNCVERIVLCFLWTTVSKVDGTKGFLNALKTRNLAKDCSDTEGSTVSLQNEINLQINFGHFGRHRLDDNNKRDHRWWLHWGEVVKALKISNKRLKSYWCRKI